MLKLTGFTVFSILMAYLSILLCASPNLLNASLAAGCGSLTPILENTSPNAEIEYAGINHSKNKSP